MGIKHQGGDKMPPMCGEDFFGEGKVRKIEIFSFRRDWDIYLFPHKIMRYFRARKSNLNFILTAYGVNERYRSEKYPFSFLLTKNLRFERLRQIYLEIDCLW